MTTTARQSSPFLFSAAPARGEPPLAVAAASGAYAWGREHVLFPAWQQLTRVGRALAELDASQWLPPEEIEQRQLASLKALLIDAGANVPYYKQLFAERRFDPRGVTSRGDLRALPILTREIIAERRRDLVAPGRRGDEGEIWQRALRLRGDLWGGYSVGRPAFHYGVEPTLPPGLTGAKMKADRALWREVHVDAVAQDVLSLRHAVAVLRSVRPRVLIGCTQSTVLFARFILDRGLRDWEDIHVLCDAEAVLPEERAVLGRAFGPAFEVYGSRDGMLLAAECAAHDGMHLSEEHYVVEVVDGASGEPAPASEEGDVVVTALHGSGMPLIRYATGGVAIMGPIAACPCGRSLRKVLSAPGHRPATLRARDGTPVPGALFVALLGNRLPLVSAFRVAQGPSLEVVLHIVRGDEWSDTEFDGIARRIRARLQDLPLVVHFVDSITPHDAAVRSGTFDTRHGAQIVAGLGPKAVGSEPEA